MLLKDDRACIALADMKSKEYKIVNNTDYDFITDPSAPSFNKDGSLNFCSNDRGRLEVFTVTPNSDGTTFTYTPAVSDPIAALWAYKNDIGVFYLSYASTGNVIKIKPVEEWKVVPDFDGPSPAGQIMTFRELEDDYPDFDPVAVMTQAREDQETEAITEDDAQESTDADSGKKHKKNKDEVTHRSQEALDKLENLEPAVTELQNEKRFLGKINPILYSPLPTFVSDKDDIYLGFGGFFLGQTARLQMKQGIVMFDAFYYPKIKNFTGDFVLEVPVGTGTLDLYIARNNSFVELQGSAKDLFSLTNLALAGYTHPIIARGDMKKTNVLSALFYAGGIFNQQAEKAFAINAPVPFTKSISFHTGLDYSSYINQRRDSYIEYSIVNLLLGNYDFTTKKTYLGYEGEFAFKTGNKSITQEISTVVRYTDFPSATVPYLSRAHFAGKHENCEYPGKILLNYSYIFPGVLQGVADGSVKLQGLASFSNKTFVLEKKAALDFELDFPLSQGQKFTGGFSMLFDLNDMNKFEPEMNFYIQCKMNWLRF